MRRCPQCGAVYRGNPQRCPLDSTVLVQEPDSNLGREVGGWRLFEIISEGVLAAVYRAEKKAQVGALKLYRPSAPLKRASREGEACSRVAHPHVAMLLDSGTTADGEVFIVTELVEGRSLRSLLDQDGARGLPWLRAVRIAQDTASGLMAIHGHGLVHRDLKPENIMLAGDARDPRKVTILDLGHALVLDMDRLTQSGLVCGSAPYMSPEQAAGLPLDHRSDLYSLGVVLYEMLLGRRPFEARAAADVMQMHWSKVPLAPARAADVPLEVSDLCMWLLAKRPERRPGTARVVHAALAGLLARGPGRVGARSPRGIHGRNRGRRTRQAAGRMDVPGGPRR